MNIEFFFFEVRIIGCLIEKEVIILDYYLLIFNSLIIVCN